jgi:hypothetical protein
MQNALWLASVFGPFLTILGLWMLFYTDNLMKVVNGVKNSAPALYFSGVTNLLIGLFTLSQYDVWAGNAYVLVTIFGWYLVVRGLMALFVPQLFIRMLAGNSSFTRVMGIIPLAWGIALSWLAFFM